MNYALLIYETAAGFALRTDPKKSQSLLGSLARLYEGASGRGGPGRRRGAAVAGDRHDPEAR